MSNEEKIINAIKALDKAGAKEYTGNDISLQAQKDDHRRFNLIGFGTLYNVLSKLEKNGTLTSRWVGDKFPRKKYYSLVVK